MSLSCADPSVWCRALLRARAFLRRPIESRSGRGSRLAADGVGLPSLRTVSRNRRTTAFGGCCAGTADGAESEQAARAFRGAGTRHGRSVTSRCVAPASLTVTAVGVRPMTAFDAASSPDASIMSAGTVTGVSSAGPWSHPSRSNTACTRAIGEARLERDCSGDGVTADRDLVRVDRPGERGDVRSGYEVERRGDLVQPSSGVGQCRPADGIGLRCRVSGRRSRRRSRCSRGPARARSTRPSGMPQPGMSTTAVVASRVAPARRSPMLGHPPFNCLVGNP